MNAFQTIFLIATAAPTVPSGVALQTAHEMGASTAQQPVRAGYVGASPVPVTYGSGTSTSPLPTASERAITFAPVSASMDALERLRGFAFWPENWDGAGAPAVSLDVLDAATNLFGLIDNLTYVTPSVALNAHGEPMFMLLDEAYEVSVTLVSPNTVHYYVHADGIEDGGSARFDGRRTPSKVASALRRAGMTYA